VNPEMISEVAADFRLGLKPSVPEQPAEASSITAESNESMLRSLFRALRSMDDAQRLDEKPIPSADGRRV